MSLPLGAIAKIGDKPWRVLGAMVRRDDEGSEWSEYLMFTPKGEFFWLVETDEGWSRATVLDAFAMMVGALQLSRAVNDQALAKELLDNATNKLYRNHLNYLKDVLPEMGRNFKLVYSVSF